MSDASPVLATDARRVAVMTVLTVLAGAVDAVRMRAGYYGRRRPGTTLAARAV